MRRKAITWIAVIAVLAFALVFIAGKEDKGAAPEKGAAVEKEDVSGEEYVNVLALSSLPMFAENDHAGLFAFGDEYGVKVTIAGPTEWDIDAQARTVEEVAARKPAGIIVHGFSPALKGAIDKAIDAGIPVVCVDGDVPDSKALSFIGTDWYQVGVVHAHEMARLTGGKGKVAALMVIGIDIYEDCAQGYKDGLAKYPGMELLGVYNDETDTAVTARLTNELISANPDLAGISVFDATTPGVGAAIKELGLAGKVKVTGMNVDPPQIKYLEEGVIQVLVGQKRALFGYYGAKMLYDYNHSAVNITPNDAGVGVTNIPPRVDTGLFVITPENVKAFKGEG
ncbi:MAG TPA: substrate-binding domain-containing protein [Spirochaetota bacterium]|nr:substrate-binding domain-containing protein [Spirochaetota bacterium]